MVCGRVWSRRIGSGNDGDSGRDQELWVGRDLPEPGGVWVGEEEAGAVDRRGRDRIGSQGTEGRLGDSQGQTDCPGSHPPHVDNNSAPRRPPPPQPPPKGWPSFSLQSRLWTRGPGHSRTGPPAGMGVDGMRSELGLHRHVSGPASDAASAKRFQSPPPRAAIPSFPKQAPHHPLPRLLGDKMAPLKHHGAEETPGNLTR